MSLRMSALLIAGAALLGSCTGASFVQESRTPKAQRELADALAGRVAGKAERCIPNFRGNEVQIIDDWTILYREGRTIYVQNPQGGCRGLENRGYTLVTRQVGVNQFCEGDINQLVDLRTGSFGGTCVFGPFVPYRKVS